jgi:hypothetical protein
MTSSVKWAIHCWVWQMIIYMIYIYIIYIIYICRGSDCSWGCSSIQWVSIRRSRALEQAERLATMNELRKQAGFEGANLGRHHRGSNNSLDRVWIELIESWAMAAYGIHISCFLGDLCHPAGKPRMYWWVKEWGQVRIIPKDTFE